jgi:phage shock protein PspC (stress-responsive transcriptional regulator)
MVEFLMITSALMVVGFTVYIAATWMYGQKEDQA